MECFVWLISLINRLNAIEVEVRDGRSEALELNH